MSRYTVELTIPADNSWTIRVQARVREHLHSADQPERLPSVEAVGGSGSGTIVLRWVELQAGGAWPATRAAIDQAVQIIPELATIPYLDVSAKHQEPGAAPPPGA